MRMRPPNAIAFGFKAGFDVALGNRSRYALGSGRLVAALFQQSAGAIAPLQAPQQSIAFLLPA